MNISKIRPEVLSILKINNGLTQRIFHFLRESKPGLKVGNEKIEFDFNPIYDGNFRIIWKKNVAINGVIISKDRAPDSEENIPISTGNDIFDKSYQFEVFEDCSNVQNLLKSNFFEKVFKLLDEFKYLGNIYMKEKEILFSTNLSFSTSGLEKSGDFPKEHLEFLKKEEEKNYLQLIHTLPSVVNQIGKDLATYK